MPMADEHIDCRGASHRFGDLVLLAADGGDRNRITVLALLSEMTAEEWRALRLAISRIDGLMDQVALERHLRRSKAENSK